MKIVAAIILLLPTVVLAQNYQNMSQEEIQQMMQQAQQMQQCMQNIDQDKLNAIEDRSKQMDSEIKALCAEGKRDEAQAKAVAFGMEMSKDPTMQEMRKCGEMSQGMMPKSPFMEQYQADEKDRSIHHVCDQ
jgi:hypothetical protein